MEPLLSIFSGIGVAVINWVKEFFSERRNKKNENKSKLELEKSSLTDSVSIPTEKEKLTQRFQYVLTLMDNGGFTKAKLAKIMKLDKISSLEKYATGEEEPSFEFLEQFCEKFGINFKWMTEGISEPFYNEKDIRFDPIDYYEEIKRLQPEKIYFIRCNSQISEFFIVLKLADWNYLICQNIWHLSNYVGSSGEAQLVKFYNLVNKLRDNGFYLKCSGRTLTHDEFNKLYQGKEFPANIININQKESSWWDDFTDINHTYPIAKNYLEMYGQSFIDAQNKVSIVLQYGKSL